MEQHALQKLSQYGIHNGYLGWISKYYKLVKVFQSFCHKYKFWYNFFPFLKITSAIGVLIPPVEQVCAPSCHDCSTMRAWWEEDEERRYRFYKNVIGCNDIPPPRCTTDIAYFIIEQHMRAPSMWAIFPLQVPALFRQCKFCYIFLT